MAEKSFPLPDLGEGLIDATILEWLVKPGDRIERNDPLVEVETTKSALELPSPMSGVVKTLHGESGDVVQVGSPLVTFETPDAEAGIVGTVPAEQAPARSRVRLSIPED
jgi:pyruvate dehydrogenase E2 component (dihydrolipoamide acetyltransferase)